jgi:hypothetical protein
MKVKMKRMHVQRALDLFKDLSAEEKAKAQRISMALEEIETSELATGKLLIQARAIFEKYGLFWRFLNTCPFTERTAYRRIKTYERALQMWAEEVVEVAIKQSLAIIGSTNEQPMGFFENVPAPARNLTTQKIREYLVQAEVEARRKAESASKEGLDAYELLKMCFRQIQRGTNEMSPKERETFLKDLVGVEMTLLGATGPQKFTPVEIPQDFWTAPKGSFTRSPETRARMVEAARSRWERVKEAKLEKLKRRA